MNAFELVTMGFCTNMPIPRRVIEKRGIIPSVFFEHVKAYLYKNVQDDSLDSSIKLIDEADFIGSFSFQRMLHTLPLTKQQRQETEVNYMKAVIIWKL